MEITLFKSELGGGELLEMVFSNVYCVLLGQSHLPMGGDIKGE